MQRIRYGLTGLAFVFLFVLLGTAISRSRQDVTVMNASNVSEPKEPLAELGVAPGQRDTVPGNEAASQAGNNSVAHP
jgi:hypothetical protein